MPARTALWKSDEIINVEIAPPREVLAQAESGYGYWLPLISEGR